MMGDTTNGNKVTAGIEEGTLVLSRKRDRHVSPDAHLCAKRTVQTSCGASPQPGPFVDHKLFGPINYCPSFCLAFPLTFMVR
jgi:hypothetical protein